MFNIDKVIEVAKKEVDYKEAKGNITKYAAWFDKEAPGFYNTKKQGAAWCDIFVDWCFCQAYGTDNGRKMLYQPLKSCGAGVKFSYDYFKKKGAVGVTASKGAQIFFKNKKGEIVHTGLVSKVDKTHVYTIEGNKDDQVKECKYPLNSTKIFGYGYPDFDLGESVPDPVPEPVKSYKVRIIAKSGLRVRQKATTDSKTLYVLPFDTIVEVTDYNDEWLKTKDGYIYKKWTEKVNFSNKY